MKKTFLFAFLLLSSFCFSQNALGDCKVLSKYFSYGYKGECKNGLASGKGEAKGKHWYIGDFKNGLPNGKGVIKYDAYQTYTGNFQDGYKEGKGEFVYKIKVENDTIFRDSIVKGYWCNDEYTGKSYVTYKMNPGTTISSYDVSPSKYSGNMVAIKVTNTSDIEKVYLTGISVKSNNNDAQARIVSNHETEMATFTNIQILAFPIVLEGKLSDGANFELELYKNANWNVSLFINK